MHRPRGLGRRPGTAGPTRIPSTFLSGGWSLRQRPSQAGAPLRQLPVILPGRAAVVGSGKHAALVGEADQAAVYGWPGSERS
jgi:hypothetical protein